MRSAITLHRQHGETAFQVVAGPEVPVEEQRQAVRGLARAGRTHPELAEVQLWHSDHGLTKRVKFDLPKPAEATAPTGEPDGQPADSKPAPAPGKAKGKHK